MNIAAVTEKVRTRIRLVMVEVVAEVTQSVMSEVMSQITAQLGGGVLATPKKVRTLPATTAAPTTASAAPVKKTRRKKADVAGAAPGATRIRYNLDASSVLAKLAFYGENGSKAETIRNEFFSSTPATAFTRVLKKLIESGYARVAGERRAAMYFITPQGAAILLAAPALPTTVPAPAEDEFPPSNGSSTDDEAHVSTRLLQDNTAS